MGDIHSYGDDFANKLKPTKFTAIQEYRFKCGSNSFAAFPGFERISIKRRIEDSTGRGCFAYLIEKTGSRAFIDPLPRVKKRFCKTEPDLKPDYPVVTDLSNLDLRASLSAINPNSNLHEPRYLRLSLENNGRKSQYVDLGLNFLGNIRINAIYPSGRKVEGFIRRFGIGAPGEVRIAPKASHSVDLLLNEWFDFDEVGEYQIEVALMDRPTLPAASLANASIKIGATPDEWSRIKKTASELAMKAVGSEPMGIRIRAAETLSYMRHPAAVEGLSKIVRQAPLIAPIAVAGLGRIESTEARAALSAARNSQDPDVADAASGLLQFRDRSKNDAIEVAD